MTLATPLEVQGPSLVSIGPTIRPMTPECLNVTECAAVTRLLLKYCLTGGGPVQLRERGWGFGDPSTAALLSLAPPHRGDGHG